ncbi:MAG: rod shape-determining protein MreC [Candidatus Zixiibacteriota bacterium]|nr:MAG: rod shape-determining protein MreC [candidate division Zixibacteria bacterium]
MRWISSILSRYRRNVHFVSFLLLSSLLIFDAAGQNQYISQVALSIFHSPFAALKHSYLELTAVAAEKFQLRQSLVEASLRLTELDEVRLENGRLRQMLGFDPPPDYRLLPARVLSVSRERVAIEATINRGINDSVFVNQCLVNREGLIGRIVSVTPDYATVQLLTHSMNRVAVRVASSREMGIARYVPGDGLMVDNFPVQGRVSQGDLILSSGLGGVYPPGLVVGSVASVIRPEEEAFCEIRLYPAANFSSLEELFVLIPDAR